MAFQELNSDYNVQWYHGNYCYPECQSSPSVANSPEKRLNQLAANAVKWRHYPKTD